MTRTRPARADEGFTAVELLVVMVLLGIIGAMGAVGIIQGMRTSAHGEARVHALAATQTGVERLSRELRAADPLEVASPDHVEVSIFRGDEFNYYIYRADADGDRWHLIEERWRFTDPAVFNDPGFSPSAGAANSVSDRILVRDLVSEEIFEFLTATGGVATGPSDARQVRISVERLVQPGRNPIVVETQVKLRNA